MRNLKKEKTKEVTTVSDVDGHLQCLMSVDVEEGKVIDSRGDPLDPEGRSELTLRGKHMKSVLYAPDRLQCPMKRVGEKGGGEWERISWDEALTTIANRLNEIKEKYGADAIQTSPSQ
jgi:anaerobic selenocysteine-containing dehydrogenase